jgi:hypothetical protein
MRVPHAALLQRDGHSMQTCLYRVVESLPTTTTMSFDAREPIANYRIALKEHPHTLAGFFIHTASGTYFRNREPAGKGGIRLHFPEIPRYRPRV